MMKISQRPTQAVILAGGQGTRLRPLTEKMPKPMVQIGGKPFLEYQIEQLRDQGFERVLLLLGYLPEVVCDYFGDGRRWGVSIEYSITAVDDDTGRRIKLAEALLEPCFLLLYCDNYWPMNFAAMWRRFVEQRVAAMITVYRNRDGYTRNSVRVEDDGLVSIYDKSGTEPRLNGVEISYAILSKSITGLLNGENQLFETTVYPELTRRRQLAGFTTDHRYYSVGALHRLPLTEEFFRRKKTVILDRDGVLNEKPARAHYVRDWNEFVWLPGALDALRLLHQNDYRIIIVSNQAGVARGAMSASALSELHVKMNQAAEAAGSAIAAIYTCPHDWDEGCDCRKPAPGMFFAAQRDFHLDLTRCYFFGDDDRDAEAARRAGCRFIQVTDSRPLINCVRQLLETDGFIDIPRQTATGKEVLYV